MSHQDVSCLIVSVYGYSRHACLNATQSERIPSIATNFTATLSLAKLLPISLPIRYSEMGSTTGMVTVRVGFKYVFVLEYQTFGVFELKIKKGAYLIFGMDFKSGCKCNKIHMKLPFYYR